MSFWPIFFVVVIIFIITIIILWIAELFVAPRSPAGPECTSSSTCGSGKTCQNGSCKSIIGGTCSNISDCVIGAIACNNGVCISQPRNGIGQPCPCQEGLICQNGFCRGPIGVTCNFNTDCSRGNICILGTCAAGPTGVTGIIGVTGICPDQYIAEQYEDYTPTSYQHIYTPISTKSTKSTTSPREDKYFNPCLTSHECPYGQICSPRIVTRGYRNGQVLPVVSKKYLHGENAVDVATYQDDIYILLEGGDILKVKEHLTTSIQNLTEDQTTLILDRIIYFCGHLYGIGSGDLYRLVDENQSIWTWSKVDHLHSGIKHICTTFDGNYIWIESRSQGYLYDRNWGQVEHIKKKKFVQRIYGYSNTIWVDIYSDNTGITYDGRKYDYLKTAAYLPDGYLLTSEKGDIYMIRILHYNADYVPFFIMERACITQ